MVTNIDREHLDFYRDLDNIKAVFADFIDRVPFYGLAVLCLDNEAIQDLIPKIQKRYTTYGMNISGRLSGPRSNLRWNAESIQRVSPG